MADSYVCSGAMMKCTMGTCPARLTVLPIRTVFLTGQPMANIIDHQTMVNLAPFGLCRSLAFPATAAATAAALGTLTPMPCMHNTPFPWIGGKMDYLVKGQPALLKSSKCQCLWGGTICLINDGQSSTGQADMSKKPVDTLRNQSGDVSKKNKRSYSPHNSKKSEQSLNRNKIFSKGIEGIKQGAKDIWNDISAEFNGLWNSVSDRISGMINNISEKIDKRKYILSIIRSNLKYNPEPPDVILSQSLISWFAEADIVNSIKNLSEEGKIDYLQNTLRPKLNEIMGINIPQYSWFDRDTKFYDANGNLIDFSTTFGFHYADEQNQHFMYINSDYLSSNDDNAISILLNTILHESKHARQYDAVNGLSDFGYSKELLDSWSINFQKYISSEESDEGYMKQPIELDAWFFSEEIIYDGLIDLKNYK